MPIKKLIVPLLVVLGSDGCAEYKPRSYKPEKEAVKIKEEKAPVVQETDVLRNDEDSEPQPEPQPPPPDLNGEGGVSISPPEPQKKFAWVPLTVATNDLKPSFQIVQNRIFAIIGTRIALWDASLQAWSDVTIPIEGLRGEFQVISPTDIYAIVGNAINRWDGATWEPVTSPIEDLKDSFHFVGNNAIYARVGNQIQKWDETAWIPLTVADTNMGAKLHFISEKSIYARIGQQISFWNGLQWNPLTVAQENLTDAFDVVSDNEIYALLGEKVKMWDGKSWQDFTDTLAGIELVIEKIGSKVLTKQGNIISAWEEK